MKYLNFRSVLSVIQTKHVGERVFVQMTLHRMFKAILGEVFQSCRLFCYHLLHFRPDTTWICIWTRTTLMSSAKQPEIVSNKHQHLIYFKKQWNSTAQMFSMASVQMNKKLKRQQPGRGNGKVPQKSICTIR